ncbi:aromatic ring-opening dioxygenase LigA [Cellulomonas sp. URHB0016]
MSTAAVGDKSGTVRVLALLTIIAGVVYIIAGAITWGAVASNLAAEKITVSDDASNFQGELVDTPWEAWVQADIINHHALDASGGKTYAELDREDPTRDTVMTASFLRASLFTSVVAFGVALLVVGTGIVLIMIGWALRAVAGKKVVVESTPGVTDTAPAPASTV